MLQCGPALGAALIVVALAACDTDGAASNQPSDNTAGSVATSETEPAPVTVSAPVSEPQPEAGSATTAAPSTVARSEPDEVPKVYDFAAVSVIVRDFVDDRGLNGAGLIIVHRDDGVIHEEHWGEFSPDRISLIASSSKMITAGILLRLHDDGLLDIDAPVADVADWGSGNPEITPAQLVSNSSGLVGLLPVPQYGPYVCQFIPVGTLQECAAGIFNTSDDDGDIIAPDTSFRYGGAQWQVAGAVAEVASGKSWAQLIDEIYVQPCRLDTLAFNNHFTQIGTEGFDYPTPFDSDPSTLAPTDNPNMEAGAYVTTGDYGKLLLMHLRGGLCDDNRVLSAEAVDLMHEDRVDAVYAGDAGIGTGYGMGWWVDRASGRILDQGAYGAVPWIDLDDGYGVYLVIEADALAGIELAGQLYELVDEIVNAV